METKKRQLWWESDSPDVVVVHKMRVVWFWQVLVGSAQHQRLLEEKQMALNIFLTRPASRELSPRSSVVVTAGQTPLDHLQQYFSFEMFFLWSVFNSCFTLSCLMSCPCEGRSMGQLTIFPIHIMVLVWLAADNTDSSAKENSKDASWRRNIETI